MLFILNVYIANLDVFSMNERILYIFLTVLGIFVSYSVIKPLISLLISINSLYLLSYAMSSLLIFLTFLIVILLEGKVMPETYHLLKFILQSLAIFGVVLCIIKMTYYIRDKLKI